jgi:hypothetical protein
LQITVEYRKDYRFQLMLFQQVLEIHNRGVFRDWRAQSQTRELSYERDLIRCLFHRSVAQGEPVLQQMNAQHGFFSTATCLRVIRFDQL